MTHAQPAPQPRQQSGSTWFKVLWLVILAWGLLLMPLGVMSLGAGVERDLRWSTCDVTDATAEETHDAAQPWRITFEATQCPLLIYTDGVTADNAEQLAATIQPGPYEVRLHESAIHPDGYVRYAESVTLRSYRPMPADGNIEAPSGY